MDTENSLERTVNQLLSWVVILGVFVAFIFAFLFFFGYGHLKLSLPSDAIVTINGHRVDTNANLRLRSGSYDIIVTSAYYALRDDTVRVHPLLSTTYKPAISTGSKEDEDKTGAGPMLVPRNTATILSSTIVTDSGRGAPLFSQSSWFANHTWIAGQLKLSGQFIALHYSQTHWQVAYYLGAPGYPTDLSQLPTAVANYITAQEAAYAAHGD